jgi:hypothetical protein
MGIDVLKTMLAELDECAALLRPHYTDESDDELRFLAMYWRPERYKNGCWPSDLEIRGYKARAAEKRAAAEQLAAAKVAAE